MPEWYCFKCKEKVIETEIEVEYMGITFSQKFKALKCPTCKNVFIPEEEAKKIRMGEDLIETKAV
jgi:RNase P subunit RPR2